MLEELADLAILLLDELDGDVDLEPWLAGSPPNRSLPLDVEGDWADCEPSLGSLDRIMDQSQWTRGTIADLELDQSDSEPMLGSPAGGIGNQEHWAQGLDAEEDGNERDLDGDEMDWNGDEGGAHVGNGLRFIPADAEAVAEARQRLGAIMDRVGGRQ